MTRVTLVTANTPGAVAILQLHGEGVADVLQQLTGRHEWIDRRAYLCNFVDIDEGLAIALNGQAAQLMPHGGPRVVQRLIDHLTRSLGFAYDPTPDTRAVYPEAATALEADLLDAIARATSPAAIDLLAEQPKRWRGLLQQTSERSESQRPHIANHARTLDRLIHPPTVVVIGPANVGKSTLTNALMGQAVSIVADLPGTTRDWVGGLVELNPPGRPGQAIAVQWVDTPGLRDSDDDIEQRAIALARQQIERADVVIAMRDPDLDWPDTTAIDRTPDLWLMNKSDSVSSDPSEMSGRSESNPLPISALEATGLETLQALVIDQLGLSDIESKLPWAFSPTLKSWCEGGDLETLKRYFVN